MSDTVDYRKIADALADALDKLKAATEDRNKAHAILSSAEAKMSAAQMTAAELQHQLQAHLAEVLPVPNAAARR